MEKVHGIILSVLSAAFLGWSVLLYNGWVDVRGLLIDIHRDLTQISTRFEVHQRLPAHREQTERFNAHVRESDLIMQRNSERMLQHEREIEKLREGHK